MAKLVTPQTEKDKHNFYFTNLLKYEFALKLKQSGHTGNVISAGLRALVRLYVEGHIPQEVFDKTIKEEIYITPSGKLSKQ